MLRICTNGHLTGQRHCGTCGADTPQIVKGPSVVRGPVKRDKNGHNYYEQLRQETRIGGNSKGRSKAS